AGDAEAKGAVTSAALTVDASDLSGWTEAGDPGWREEATSITDPSGSYPASGSGLPVLHADNCDAECRISQNDSLDLTMAESATLTFLRYVDVSLDSSDYLRMDFWNGSWNQEVVFSGTSGAGPSGQDDGQWLALNYDLADSPDGLSYLDRSDFQIRVRALLDQPDEIVELDDIRIQVTHVLGPDLDWTESGEGDWTRRDMLSSSAYPTGASGSPVASMRSCSSGCTLTSDPVDLGNADSGTLSLLRYLRSYIDSSDYLRLQVWDGSAWITEYDWNGSNGGDSNQWEQVAMDLAASPTGRNYLGQSDFQVRLSARADSSNEYIEVDDVTLVTACAPSADPDVCDGQDNDCDGTIDEDGAASCPASTECLESACVNGACVTNHVEGLCSDSTVCTTNEYCEDGACVATGTLDCHDGNECTDDVCDPLQGCDNPHNTATCDDGDSCTAGDVCSAGACDGTPITACQNADGCCPSGCNDQNDSDCGCGDGVLDPGEECDDGNNDLDHCGPLAASATCVPLCTWVDGLVCGDQQLDPGEECDDGNLDNGDGCQADCTICTNPASADDICDGNDDDCDGRFDEDVVGRVTSCGEGACFAYSTQSCQGGAFVPAECVPHAPGLEGACDGIDDDCDGSVDEDTSQCQQCSAILASAQDHAEAGRAYRVATCAPIFADHFDGDLSAWTVTGTVDIVSASTTDLSGPGARLRGASELRVGVDTSHYDSAQLRYWRRGSSLEGNDTYEARYSADGGLTWTTLESTAGSVRVGPRAYALPDSDSLLISFQTTFDSTSSDRLYLDDIVVTSGADLGVGEEFEGSLRLYLADGTVSLEEGQGDRFARLAGGTSSQSNPRGELELEVDTAAFASPALTYRSQGAGPSDPDTPDVDYSTDGGQSWTALQPTLVVNDTTDRYAVDLPADPRLRLRFTGPDGDIQDAVYLRGLAVDDAGTTADTIFSDDFDTDLSQWEVISENLAVEIEDDGNGSGSLRIDGDAELRALIDTAPYGATLDIESSLEGTAGLTFRYTTDGVTWTTVHTGPRSFHDAALELPASSQLLLSLLAENASGTGNEAHVERIRVRARPRPAPIVEVVELQAATSDLGILIPATTGSASITESSSAGHLGLGTGIRMTGPGEVTLAIDTSGHDSAELQFWTHSESMESSDIFRVSYSLDGGTTYESDNLYLHHGTTDWQYRTPDLPISANLVIKFEAQLSSTSDHALLDEVRVIARPQLPATGCEEWLLEGTRTALGQDPTLVSTVFETTAASGNWLATTTGDLTCDGLDEDCDGTVDEQCEGLVAASDGTLLIELEGYDAVESGEDQHWAIAANPEASQGLAVHLEDGGTATPGDEPWLHYEVRFTQPGRYYAWLRADVTQAAGSWTYPHIHLQGQHIT
ncbi:MAG: hypothetical protein OXT09_18605, partial [Myxococcales bacterium]|nr:hypothetical protein [Myxococcales bacterium]